MCEILNYFERKGFEIWNAKPNDVEGTKDLFYLNIIKNDEGYLVIMSIRGTCRFSYEQMQTLDEYKIRILFNRMKNRITQKDPEINEYQYQILCESDPFKIK